MSIVVAPPAPLIVVSAVARLVATSIGTDVDDRVSAGPAPGSWTLETAPRYAQVTNVAGPTPVVRGSGSTVAWTSLVQVDLYERVELEDPDLVAWLLADLADTHTDKLGDAARWRVTLETAQRVDATLDPGWTRHRLDVRVTSLR